MAPLFILLSLLYGCAKPNVAQRITHFEDSVKVAGFELSQLDATIPIKMARRLRSTASPVRIYIEGDGYAWKTRLTPSDNPTPIEPEGFYLAAIDPAPNVIYLGRPHQYFTNVDYQKRGAWLNARFGEAVINQYMQIFQHLKQAYGFSRFELIGYSGGAQIALLLAAMRNDIDRVITVAGNLDHEFWTQHHVITPLRCSLNAANYPALATLKQLHFVGSHDRAVPLSVAQSYLKKLDLPPNIVVTVKGVGHSHWHAVWPQLLFEHTVTLPTQNTATQARLLH